MRRWRDRAFEAWLDRRLPIEDSPVTLHRRRVYILPTRLGWTFAAMIVALLIGSLNYETSLGFAATFFLVGVGVTGMIRTYRNLQDLHLRFAPAAPVFAGEPARFPISLEAVDATRWGLRVQAGSPLAPGPGDPRRNHIVIPTQHRGRLLLPRFTVETNWPLALFRVWSWVRPGIGTIVYPRAVDHGRQPAEQHVAGERGRPTRTDDEDFSGLREYHPGDPVRRIAWKAFARSGDLYTKTFEAERAGDWWFDWDSLAGLAPEQRLEQLTRWVIDAHERGDRWGLHLPGHTLAADSGAEHRACCLEALALHGLPVR